MLRSPLAGLLLAGALLLAGCSGGDDNFDPAASATSVAPAPTPPTPTRPASDDPFCNFFATFTERFGRVNLGLADPQQFRTVMEQAAAAISDAQASAPDAIRADVGVMSQAFQQLLTILRQANFDFTKISPESLNVLNVPEYQASSERLEAYTRDNCL